MLIPTASWYSGPGVIANNGFDYTQMRAHHGLAWYPVIDTTGEIRWLANSGVYGFDD